ncbi:hypothetical protein GGI07_003329 [Coemansia sp. Benny D115]|nr:hypothetical protein GGI07_003329 [Coemansia sp. Benny D115]
MDEETEHELRRHLANTVMNLPLGQLPPEYKPQFTAEADLKLITEGMAKARVLEAKARADNEAQLTAHLSKALASDSMPSTVEMQVVELLQKQPELVKKIAATPQYLRFIFVNCLAVFEQLVQLGDDAATRNAVVQGSVASPMSAAQHNALVRVLVSYASQVTSETLCAYLDVVEATCRVQKRGEGLVHSVRSACFVFNTVLAGSDAPLPTTVHIQLTSFCLSYSWIEEAAVLYRRLMAAKAGAAGQPGLA